MSTRVALYSGASSGNLVPAFKDESVVVVSAQKLEEMQEYMFAMGACINDKVEHYQRVTETMQREIRVLNEGKKCLEGQLNKLESEFVGSQEGQRALEKMVQNQEKAHGVMEETLQRQKQENARLRGLVEESSSRSAQVTADLAKSKRNQGRLKKSLSEQTALLELSDRRAKLEEKIRAKQKQKEELEQELQTIKRDINKQREKIVVPTTVVAGGLLAAITGGIGGLIVGAVGGALGGSAAADSSSCPCMTGLVTKRSSAEERLDAVNREMGVLEEELDQLK